MNDGLRSLKPCILVVPLDWGLGHGTRCIPIIRVLLDKGCKVYLAGQGQVKTLLQQEFPFLPFLELRGYNVHYSVKRWQLILSLIRQAPSIFDTIYHEHRWLKQQVGLFSFDAVISDNRYGLYHTLVPTVFITHQLYIKTGLGRFADRLLQKLNYRWIRRFKECWVPDTAGTKNLAGALSHPLKKPRPPLKYIGVLSRFHTDQNIFPKKHLLCIISGPEPQRTILEKLLLEQLAFYDLHATMIRGKPGPVHFLKRKNIEIIDHLPARELEEKIASASFVISRCGYSTVMDLVRMNKKSILIPTPGQPEQEYLSKHLMKNNIAFCIDQDKFNLPKTLQLAEKFCYEPFVENKNDELENILAGFIAGLSLFSEKK